MNRFQASAIHLGCSVLVGAGILLWLYTVWYPGILLTLTGGFSLLKLLMSVDIIIGPLITLVIFKPEKKSLKFDLSCICALQMMALAYGLHTMWLARPVWLAYVNGYFQIVTVPKIIGEPGKSEWASLRSLPVLGPKLIGLRPDNQLRGQLDIEVGLLSGASLAYFAYAWKPYELIKKEAIQKGKLLEALKKTPSEQALAQQLKERYGHSAVWLPLRGGESEAIILIDAVSGQCLEMVRLP